MGSNPLYWDAQKMLDLYLLDYMVKKNMHESAAIFGKEADICSTPVVINTPDGFLHEWFSMFYDVYASRQLMAQQAEAEASVVQAMQMRENEGRNIHERATQQATQACPQLHKGSSSRQSTGDFGPSLHPSPVAINTSHLLQQFSDNDQQQAQDNRCGISFGRTPTVDPTLYGSRSAVIPVTGGQHAVAVNPRTLEGSPLRIGQWRQTSADQQQHDWLQEQQLLENVRRRQIAPYLRAGQSLLGNINAKQDIPVEDNPESFLSYGDANADGTNTPFRCLRHRTTACNSREQKGLTFEEVGSLHSSKSKVICCHFSSDGKFLASAGHEKKPLIWNMETFNFVKSSEGHSLLITDVRFQSNSTTFATSSFDKTVKIWDAATLSKPLATLEGHTEQVMSLDFHPRKVNLLCSCDTSDEVRLWNVNQFTSTRVFKGATKQVRFQPRYGKNLATASGNDINVFDLETGNLESFLKRSGHAKDILSLCWDTSGKYLASVSEDSARIWSLTSNGNCIYELKSNGNRFQSCTFHPGYSLLLIIGGYQCLELWNPIDQGGRTLTVPAHKGLVAGLAESPITEMVASVSHDQCVKIWH